MDALDDAAIDTCCKQEKNSRMVRATAKRLRRCKVAKYNGPSARMRACNPITSDRRPK